MTDVTLTGNFLRSTRGFTIADGGGATWSFDSTTNKLTVALVVAAGSVADHAITNVKLAQVAQATIKGREAALGTGDVEDLTAAQVKTILALASIDLSDFTEAAQDAVLNAGISSATVAFTYNDAGNSWTTAVIDGSITNAKLRTSGALSVIGQAANATGAPADISAAADDRILRRTSSTLSFGQLTAGMFPAAVVPDAALSANVPLLNAANIWAAAQTFSLGVKTFSGTTASTASGTPVTLQALPSGDAMYLVSAWVAATGDPSNYGVTAIVATNASVARSTTLMAGGLLTITVSGLNVQATQTSGIASAIKFSIVRITV